MECYDLRSCFLPGLSGLHVRIYQFRQLLRQNLPALSAHLEALQVNPAYVSQWFLSFFAVTAPLPMLFRIYDVIFAEGASETIMRVALSLMRKNESRILKNYAYTVTLAYGGNWCATDPPEKRQNIIGSSVTGTSGIPTPLPSASA